VTPGEIRQILTSANIKLTKSLGQNFLHDRNQLRRIIEAAELTSDDRVLEIGPGLGALTQPLLQKAPVLAIEKDKRLYDILRQRLADEPRLTLIQADALDYLRAHPIDWSDSAPWKVVSNLPYSVGTAILVDLAKAPRKPDRMTVTVQHEVAQRIASAPATESYGVLSLLLQLIYEPQTLFLIPGTCFFPAPDVDSACVTLVRRPTLLLEAPCYPAFEKIVKRGFSQRRKMMMKLLKSDWPAPQLAEVFSQIGLSTETRAEHVSLEQFIALTRLLCAGGQSS
jgi:16S rRNA (adenine1518-N6/adenine1519-N6)-dimethyltransferase